MERRTKVDARPNFVRGTKSGFREVIKFGVTELFLEFCPAKLVAKPVAEPAIKTQGGFWQRKSIVRRKQNNIFCLLNGLAKLLMKILEFQNS